MTSISRFCLLDYVSEDFDDVVESFVYRIGDDMDDYLYWLYDTQVDMDSKTYFQFNKDEHFSYMLKLIINRMLMRCDYAFELQLGFIEYNRKAIIKEMRYHPKFLEQALIDIGEEAFNQLDH